MGPEAYAWLVIVSLAALIVGFAVLAYLANRVGKNAPTVIEEKRRAWGDDDVVRFPPMSQPAAKGFNGHRRDGVIGIDQVTPEERRRALRMLGLPPLE